MPKDYSSERGSPEYPVCIDSTTTLFFTGSSLIFKAKKQYNYPAISGSTNAKPIPSGHYWIRPKELWRQSAAGYIVRNVIGELRGVPNEGDRHIAAWGWHRITIHPYPDTDTQGRGGFFIHGGDMPGSAGCIDLTYYMELFVKDLERELSSGSDCYIPLFVSYGDAKEA